MKKLYIIILFFIFCGHLSANECNQIPVSGSKNYIIGYGSLMEKESRMRTNKSAKNVKPIIVKDFKREWGHRSNRYKITFLTVSKKKNAQINAVYYPLSIKGIIKLDKREKSYCRIKLNNEKLLFFKKKINLKNKNFWIYAANPKKIIIPDNQHPIVQSYVDIFLNGCFQIQDKFKINNFAILCVDTTYGWSKNWVNDRINPRRPFLVPNFYRIDTLLGKKFNFYFENKYE